MSPIPIIGAFVQTRRAADRPDAELRISFFSTVVGGTAAAFERELQCTTAPLRPSVMIRSADPAAASAICGNFPSAEYDRRVTVDAFRYVRHLLRHSPLRPYISEEMFPGPDCRSDAEIVDTCRRLGMPGAHFAGTCRMGQDPMAVLDERLRVRGVLGLRVVDGSIMPSLLSGNTSGPIMALAWRAADLILEDACRAIRVPSCAKPSIGGARASHST